MVLLRLGEANSPVFTGGRQRRGQPGGAQCPALPSGRSEETRRAGDEAGVRRVCPNQGSMSRVSSSRQAKSTRRAPLQRQPFARAPRAVQWRRLTFPELAHRVMSKYVSAEEVPSEDLLDMCRRSAANFRTEGLSARTRASEGRTQFA